MRRGSCHKGFSADCIALGREMGRQHYVFLQFRIKGNLIENKTQRHCGGHWESTRALHGPGHHVAARDTLPASSACVRGTSGAGNKPLGDHPSCGNSFGDLSIPERTRERFCNITERVCLLKVSAISSHSSNLFLHLPPELSRAFFVSHNISGNLCFIAFFNLREKNHAISLSPLNEFLEDRYSL